MYYKMYFVFCILYIHTPKVPQHQCQSIFTSLSSRTLLLFKLEIPTWSMEKSTLPKDGSSLIFWWEEEYFRQSVQLSNCVNNVLPLCKPSLPICSWLSPTGISQDNLRRFKKEQYQLTRNEDIIGFFSEFDNYITEDEMWALRWWWWYLWNRQQIRSISTSIFFSESLKPRGGTKTTKWPRLHGRGGGS